MVKFHLMFASLSKNLIAAIIATFFAVGFLVFGSVLGHEFVSWDDTYLIVENVNVHSLSLKTIGAIFTSYDPELYVPLTLLTYQLECAVSGCSSGLMHGTNLVLHILNSLLVTALLFAFFRRGWVALVLGILFLIHPLNVEAVAWASARKDVLSALFFLLSILAYLQWKNSSSKTPFRFSVVCFLLGLLSKVMVVTLPIVLLLLDWKREGRVTLRSITEKWPYWLLSLVFGVVAMFGKTDVLESTTLLQKILMAAKSTEFYLQKFFVPTDLSVVYPFTGFISIGSSFFLIPLVVCLMLLSAIVLLRKSRPWVSIGLAFFLLTLAPTFINFAKGGDVYFASDRYAYIPMIGLLLACGSLLTDWLDARGSLQSRSTKIYSSIVAALTMLAIFGTLAAKQTAVWKDGPSLYAHALRLYPKARAIQNNLGMEELTAGRIASAIGYFDIALGMRNDPRVRANRAAALMQKGLFSEARKEFMLALTHDDTNEEIHYGLGNLSQKEGKFDEAILHYKNALAIDPLYGNALNNLATVYLFQEDWTKAIEAFEALLVIRPNFTEALYNLAGAYGETANLPRAQELYERVLTLTPLDADAHASIATILYETGDIDGAAVHLQTVFDLDPANTIGHALLVQMRKDGVAE